MPPRRVPNDFVVQADGATVRVELQQGHHVVLDLEDHALVRQYRWCAGTVKGEAVGGVRTHPTRNKVIYLGHFLLGATKGQRVYQVDGDRANYRRNNLRVGTKK